MLSPAERALVLRYCWEHLLAECPGCGVSYKLDELTAEMLLGMYSSSELCPRCCLPLVDSIRSHMGVCTALKVQAAEVREHAQALQRGEGASDPPC